MYSEVGHYLNIVDPYTTDFGGAVAWGGNAQGWGDNSQRVQNYNTGVGDLTVAEYEGSARVFAHFGLRPSPWR